MPADGPVPALRITMLTLKQLGKYAAYYLLPSGETIAVHCDIDGREPAPTITYARNGRILIATLKDHNV